jgi:hypothetical protein
MAVDLMALSILWTGLYSDAGKIQDEGQRRSFRELLEAKLMKMIGIADSEISRDSKLAQYVPMEKDLLDIRGKIDQLLKSQGT